jgi:hypothetical protein
MFADRTWEVDDALCNLRKDEDELTKDIDHAMFRSRKHGEFHNQITSFELPIFMHMGRRRLVRSLSHSRETKPTSAPPKTSQKSEHRAGSIIPAMILFSLR